MRNLDYNKTFSFRQYRFTDVNNYDSLELEHASDYILGPLEEPVQLESALSEATPRPLPSGIPFPQADDLQKVMDLADLVAQGISDKDDLNELFEHAPRQSNYYGDAAAFLGLVDKKRGGVAPNPDSLRFAKKTHAGRTAEVAARLTSLPVFRDALRAAISGHPLSKEEIEVDPIIKTA